MMKTQQVLLLMVFTLCPFPALVFSADFCYVCLERCELRVENCTERYGNLPTKCVSASGRTEILKRKQCMSEQQALIFCKKYNRIEGVTCYSCDEDLCNGQAISTSSALFIFSVIYLAVLWQQ